MNRKRNPTKWPFSSLKRIVTRAMLALFFLMATTAWAGPIMVTFTENVFPTLTLLTDQYSAFGITFTDTTFYGIDPRFPSGDNSGIVPTGGTDNLMTVLFTIPTPFVTFEWFTVHVGGRGGPLTAEAFDSGDNLVDSFFFPGGPAVEFNVETGIATLSGGLISTVTWLDVALPPGGTIGVDTLTYSPIPEPGTLLLLGSGLAGLGFFRRRRKAA